MPQCKVCDVHGHDGVDVMYCTVDKDWYCVEHYLPHVRCGEVATVRRIKKRRKGGG